jgi:hypothetical protein
LTIIAIVVSLSAAAAIQIIASQRGSNTQHTIEALKKVFDSQWRAVVDRAKNEPPPASVLAIAGGDPRRARVIWVKLRLKQEFPMNFSEALYPWAGPHALYVSPNNSVPPPLTPADLPAIKTYAAALRGAGVYVPAAQEAASATQTYPASIDPRTWPDESGVLLLLALQQDRGAGSLTADDLSTTAIADAGVGGLKMIVDAWGKPLSLYRWPTPTPVLYDAQDPNNVNNREVDGLNPSGASVPFRDPLDPEGLLVDPNWNNSNNYKARNGVWWFEVYCHSAHQIVHNAYQRTAYYTTPVIVSAGRDGQRGFAQPGQLAGGVGFTHYPLPPLSATPYPSPFLPDPMVIDANVDPSGVGYHDAWTDNIASYRLRQEGRGE